MKAVAGAHAGAYATPQWGDFGVESLRQLQRAALWAAFVFVSLHWLWEDARGLLSASPGSGSGSGVCPERGGHPGGRLGPGSPVGRAHLHRHCRRGWGL